MAAKASANLNEMEGKIASLERANFDLKLQLHYLNKKHTDGNNPSVTGPELNINVIEDRSVDVLTLREEVEYSKKRILELESELLQVQLFRDREKAEFHKALQVRQPESAVVEENRRREREVAMAIAEHDALLIAKLRADLETTQVQRHHDKTLIDELTMQLESKDEELGKLLVAKKKLETEVSALEEASRGKAQALTSGGSGGNNPMLFSASSDGQQTSIVINSSSFSAGANIGGVSGPSPAPTSFLIHGGGGAGGGGAGYPYAPTTMAPALPYYPFGSQPGGSGHRYGDHPSYDALRFENEQLKGRLALLEESIRNQQVIIDNIKASAVEIKVIESEEIKRLEAELDKILEEKEKLKQRLQRVEIDYEMACRHIKDMGDHLSETDPNYSISQEFLFTPNRNPALVGMRKLIDPNNATEKLTGQLAAARREVEQLEKSIEYFRQRESELLNALEGVVLRCKELEEQQTSSTRFRR